MAMRAAKFLLLPAVALSLHQPIEGCSEYNSNGQEIADTSGDTCALTGTCPSRPRYLKFCQDYNSRKACCIPGHDLENQIQFENLIEGLGPGCKNPMMYPAIRYFYCLGCDPTQPTYTNMTAKNVTVCPKFVKDIWDNALPQYAECGVMISNPCPVSFGEDHGFDPYACGDDLIIPQHEYSSGIEFMNVFKPPGMDDYNFVEAASDDVPCWQPPFYSSAARASRSAMLGVMLLGAALRRLL